jgi:hypothetical protein
MRSYSFRTGPNIRSVVLPSEPVFKSADTRLNSSSSSIGTSVLHRQHHSIFMVFDTSHKSILASMCWAKSCETVLPEVGKTVVQDVGPLPGECLDGAAGTGIWQLSTTSPPLNTDATEPDHPHTVIRWSLTTTARQSSSGPLARTSNIPSAGNSTSSAHGSRQNVTEECRAFRIRRRCTVVEFVGLFSTVSNPFSTADKNLSMNRKYIAPTPSPGNWRANRALRLVSGHSSCRSPSSNIPTAKIMRKRSGTDKRILKGRP